MSKLHLREDEFDTYSNIDVGSDGSDMNQPGQAEIEPERSLKSETSYNAKDWSELYDKQPTDERKKNVIDRFLNAFMDHHGIDHKSITKFKPALIDQLQRYGSQSLDETKNPFLKYITITSFSNHLDKITSEDWKNLEDAYSQSAIIDRTLMGNGQNADRNIIFNASMLGRKKEDFTYLCKAFSWLNKNKSSINTIIDGLDKDQLSRFAMILKDSDIMQKLNYGDLDDAKKSIKSNLVKAIMFEGSLDNQTYNNESDKVRNAKDIYDALDYLDNQSESSDDKSTLDDLISRTVSKEATDAFTRMGVNKLNDEQARDLIAYLLNSHKGIKL